MSLGRGEQTLRWRLGLAARLPPLCPCPCPCPAGPSPADPCPTPGGPMSPHCLREEGGQCPWGAPWDPSKASTPSIWPGAVATQLVSAGFNFELHPLALAPGWEGCGTTWVKVKRKGAPPPSEDPAAGLSPAQRRRSRQTFQLLSAPASSICPAYPMPRLHAFTYLASTFP